MHSIFFIIIFILVVLLIFAIYNVYVLRKTRTNYEYQIEQLLLTRSCVFKLLSKATESLQNSVDLHTFLNYYTDYAIRSVEAESAAFFSYDHKNDTLKIEVLLGEFPTLIDVPSDKISLVTSSPEKIKKYLLETKFNLKNTPFVEVIQQKHALKFESDELERRLHFKIYDCKNMMVIPILEKRNIFGIIVLANKRTSKNFDQEDFDIAKNLAEMAGLTIDHIMSFEDIQEKISIDNQLKNAMIIQRHLMPEKKYECELFNIEVFFKPVFRIGGDYYDFMEIDANHIGVLIADVSGKGIPAGLVMATTRSLAAVLFPGELSPKNAIVKLNEKLVDLVPEGMFVSINYGILNKNTGEAVFACAGHDPMLRYNCHTEKIERCNNENGMVVGLVENYIFADAIQDHKVDLFPGDTLLQYTDGVTEAINKEGQEFTFEKLRRTFEYSAEKSASENIKYIVNRLTNFIGTQQQNDDITIMVIKVK